MPVGNEIAIAHISDLHLSTDNAWTLFDLMANDIKDSGSSLLVVTGDLVDHPQYKALEKVREKLEQLCRDCQINPASKPIVVPGNYDCRWFGNFSWDWWRTKPFNRTFPQWQTPWLINIDGRYLAIFSFDSNTNWRKVSFTRGIVGEEEYIRFGRDYNAQKQNNPTILNQAFKIALLHHHPLPIADTEVDKLTEQDVFLSLEDAGTFMREIVERRINLDSCDLPC